MTDLRTKRKGAADDLEAGTAIYRHREWRGLKDTAYDYCKWAQLWAILIRWAMAHPVQNVRAILRYRWMYPYLGTPAFLTGSAPVRGEQVFGRPAAI